MVSRRSVITKLTKVMRVGLWSIKRQKIGNSVSIPHINYSNGGKHIRIGKSELPLRDRMKSWQRLVGEALKFTISENRQFKGATPPWEAQGWVDYTVPYKGRGLLFAQRVERRPTIEETKMALKRFEKRLQDRYNPPLCNDTDAGRLLRKEWIAKRGIPLVIGKRVTAMMKVKACIQIAPDGSLTGRVSGLPAGEHRVELMLVGNPEPPVRLDADILLARVRAIQREVARFPVLDRRSPDEIIGYNKQGHFD